MIHKALKIFPYPLIFFFLPVFLHILLFFHFIIIIIFLFLNLMELDPLTGGYVYWEPTEPDFEQNLVQEKWRPAERFVRKEDLNPLYNPVPSSLTLDQRFEIIRSVGEECIEDKELRNLLSRKSHPICYDGFEPSGRMHIAQVTISSISPHFFNKKTGCFQGDKREQMRGCRVRFHFLGGRLVRAA
jgi:hypothetical protein